MFRLVRNPDPRKKPPYGSRLDPTHPLAQGLVGCWLFNEGGGNKIFNIAQNKHHGIFINTPKWAGDHISFVSGDNDYISCGTNQIGITNQLTIEVVALVRTNDRSRLISKHVSGNYGWLALRTSSDSLEFRISTTGSDWNGGHTTTMSFPINTELHFVCMYDGSYMRVFINGKEDNGGDFPYSLTGNVNDLTQDLELGRDAYSGNFPLNGYIKYGRIWKRNLTVSEIFQLYAEPYSSILAPQYWHMVDFGAITSGSLIRIINETLQIDESNEKKGHTKKIINEQIQVSEALSKRGSTKKVVNESLELNENISRISGIIKVISETLQISELVTKIPGITKVVNETLQFSESIFRKTGITKVVNEVLQIVENISKRSWTTKIVNEALNLSESVFKRGVVKKIVNETLQLSENVIRRSGLVRIINETLRISENIIRSLAVALGWREVLEADSLITLEVSKKTAITLEKAEDSTITTEISDNSPLD